MPLRALTQAIIVAWEAITIDDRPDYHRANYRFVEKPITGASSHRNFYFRNPAGDDITEQGVARHMITHTFEAVIALHLPERSTDLFDRPYQEYQALAIRVARLAVAQCIAPQVIAWRVEEPEDADEGDLDLVFTITVRTKEAST